MDDMDVDELSSEHHATKVLNTLKNTGNKESTTIEEVNLGHTPMSCAAVEEQQPFPTDLENTTNVQQSPILQEVTTVSLATEGLGIVNDANIEVKHVPSYVNDQVMYYIDKKTKEFSQASKVETLGCNIDIEPYEDKDDNSISHIENEPSNDKEGTNELICVGGEKQTDNDLSSSFEATEHEDAISHHQIEKCYASDASEELIEHELNELIDVAYGNKTQDEPVPSTSRTTFPVPFTIDGNTPASPNLSNTAQNEPTYKSDRSALKGWTKDEKYFLYLGLKLKGSTKIKDIKANLRNKTEKEIKAAIDYYKERANNHPDCTLRKLKVRRTKIKPLIPLATWAKALTDNFSLNELQTDIANAVRLIADLEEIHEPVFTESIDFRMAYHHIADAMEGKSIPENRFITEVFNSCILDTVLFSKQFIMQSAFKHIVSAVNFKEKELPLFPRPTQDNELAIIRYIAALRNYNPLCISHEHLTPSTGLATNRLRQKQKDDIE